MNDLAGIFVLAFATCVLTASVVIMGLFVGLYRREQKRFAESVLRRVDRLSDSLAGGFMISEAGAERIEAALQAMQKRLAPPEPSTELAIVAKKPEPVLELSGRARILRQLELGESPAQISDALGVPLQAIQMVAAVDKIAGKRIDMTRKSA